MVVKIQHCRRHKKVTTAKGMEKKGWTNYQTNINQVLLCVPFLLPFAKVYGSLPRFTSKGHGTKEQRLRC